MAKLKVKVETFPDRCEICHKSDQFDPEKNYCSRCDGTTTLVVQGRQRPKLYSSSEIEVAEEGDSLILTKGAFSLGTIFFVWLLWTIFLTIAIASGGLFSIIVILLL